MKMKFLITVLCLVFAMKTSSIAATIPISGVIDGDAGLGPGEGDTLDFLRFEVLTGSLVNVTQINPLTGLEYLLAEYIGLENEFGDLSTTGDFRLVFDCIGFDCEDSPPPVLSRFLEPGEYIVIVNNRFDTSYDHFDGYVAVNPEGGGGQSPYSFTVEGDIRGIDFREGNLDGTFTTTLFPIPEPSASVLALFGSALVLLSLRCR